MGRVCLGAQAHSGFWQNICNRNLICDVGPLRFDPGQRHGGRGSSRIGDGCAMSSFFRLWTARCLLTPLPLLCSCLAAEIDVKRDKLGLTLNLEAGVAAAELVEASPCDALFVTCCMCC